MTDAETMSTPQPDMTLAEQRVAGCPIKPCRGADDNDTLLRSVRSDRLLCMYCATRIPTGYIGKEEARAAENKFYRAGNNDYLIQFAVCAVGTAVGTILSSLLGVFLFVFFIGAAAGGLVGTLARRATGRRLGRYSAEVSIAGVAVGALLGPVLFIFLRTGRIVPAAAINLTSLICGAIMGVAIYGLMKGRI